MSIENFSSTSEAGLSFEQAEQMENINQLLDTQENEIVEEEGEAEVSIEKKNPGWWERNKSKAIKWAGVAALSFGSFTALGCDKDKTAPSSSGQEQATTQQAEQKGEQQAEAGSGFTEQQKEDTLYHAFDMLAGSNIEAGMDGTLILEVHGHGFYKLDDAAIQTLKKSTVQYLLMNRPHKDMYIDSTLKIKSNEILKHEIGNGVMKIGKKVPFEKLSPKLQQAAQQEEETIRNTEREMHEGSIIQPIQPRQEKSNQSPSNNQQGPTGRVSPDKDL